MVIALLIQKVHSIVVHKHSHHHGCDCFSNFMINGSLESITLQDLLIVGCFGTINLIVICVNLRSIMLVAFHRDTAKVLGVKVMIIDMIFLVSSALFINVAKKSVGLLLYSSIFLFPALLSQWISNSPKSMIVNAILIGMSSNIVGVATVYSAPSSFANSPDVTLPKISPLTSKANCGCINDFKEKLESPRSPVIAPFMLSKNCEKPKMPT